MPHRMIIAVGAALFAALPLPGLAEEGENRIWLTWEQRRVDAQVCAEKDHCKPVSTYQSRLVEKPTTERARGMLGALDQLAQARGLPVDDPDQPRICQNVRAAQVIGFDPELWELSDKLEALRGLQGVYFSVERLKAPSGFDGPFGPRIQATMEKRFRAAGIKVLTKEELETTPGKPHLNIYFSNTNPDTGCWFSVFASLTQTMLLTRNHTIKVKAGSWGMSGGYSADHPDRSELDAILFVVDRFIADYLEANKPRDGEPAQTASQ